MNTTDFTLLMWGQELHASWSTARKHFIQKHPFSLWSGGPVKAVHHVIPVHVCKDMGRYDLITDPRNFVGMASRQEHYILGHLGVSWKTASLQVAKIDFSIQNNIESILKDLEAEQYLILSNAINPDGYLI